MVEPRRSLRIPCVEPTAKRLDSGFRRNDGSVGTMGGVGMTREGEHDGKWVV